MLHLTSKNFKLLRKYIFANNLKYEPYAIMYEVF